MVTERRKPTAKISYMVSLIKSRMNLKVRPAVKAFFRVTIVSEVGYGKNTIFLDQQVVTWPEPGSISA